MVDRYIGLASLGWSRWFEEKLPCKDADRVARVATVDRDDNKWGQIYFQKNLS
jgi:hypothetical protein